MLGLQAAVVFSAAIAAAAPREIGDQPDADFLEFLGSWNSGDDHPRWVDPFQLDDPASPDAEPPNRRNLRGTRQDDPKKKPRDGESHTAQPLPAPSVSGRE